MKFSYKKMSGSEGDVTLTNFIKSFANNVLESPNQYKNTVSQQEQTFVNCKVKCVKQ